MWPHIAEARLLCSPPRGWYLHGLALDPRSPTGALVPRPTFLFTGALVPRPTFLLRRRALRAPQQRGRLVRAARQALRGRDRPCPRGRESASERESSALGSAWLPWLGSLGLALLLAVCFRDGVLFFWLCLAPLTGLSCWALLLSSLALLDRRRSTRTTSHTEISSRRTACSMLAATLFSLTLASRVNE